MKRIVVILVFLVGLNGCLPSRDTASDTLAEPVVRDRALTLEDYYRIQSVGRPQISPDGAWVLYTVSSPVEADNSTATEYWMVRTDGSAEPARVSHSGRPVSEASWTEDGKLRYTLSRRNRETRWERDIRNPRSVPRSVGEAAEGLVSPDGKWVATLQSIPFAGDVETGTRSDFEQRHEERFEGVVFDWMNFQRDGAQFPVPDPRQRPAQAILLRLVGSETPDGSGLRLIADLDLRPTNLVWSPDSRMLAFIADAGHRDERTYSSSDIWLLTIDGDVRRLTGDGYTYSSMAFSPDGRWIAYESDESGRFEIYLRRFPDATGRQLVSTSGGRKPVWNPNGGELFYRDGDKMISVEVRSEGELTLGTPTVLYERPYARSLFPTFSVTPDGQRFVDIDDSEAEHPPTQLILVQNFDDELERLVPTF